MYTQEAQNNVLYTLLLCVTSSSSCIYTFRWTIHKKKMSRKHAMQYENAFGNNTHIFSSHTSLLHLSHNQMFIHRPVTKNIWIKKTQPDRLAHTHTHKCSHTNTHTHVWYLFHLNALSTFNVLTYSCYHMISHLNLSCEKARPHYTPGTCNIKFTRINVKEDSISMTRYNWYSKLTGTGFQEHHTAQTQSLWVPVQKKETKKGQQLIHFQ